MRKLPVVDLTPPPSELFACDRGMVWIHGGAYESGKSDLYDPSSPAEKKRALCNVSHNQNPGR